MTKPIAVVGLTPGGIGLARRLAGSLGGAEIHGPAERVIEGEQPYQRLKDRLCELFTAGQPILAICAAGIVVRALAPLIGDKWAEPPVVAIAEDGSAVVPLLGGHRGANRLARQVGEVLGVGAAVTTAGDLRFGVALDDPPEGWVLANPDDTGPFAASLLGGETARLVGEAPWLRDSDLPVAEDGSRTLLVTERVVSGDPHTLVYHPKTLAVGVGSARNAPPEQAIALVTAALRDHGLASASVAGVFSIDLKADESAVHAVADVLGVPVRFFDAARLERETPRLASPSETVFREVGCHGVAEAAALAAAGPQGALRVAKVKSPQDGRPQATCAIAVAPAPIVATDMGRPRGRLFIVGLGPGATEMRTPEASAALRAADDLVGYGLYTDLAAAAAPQARCHEFALGAEEARARAALELAAEGRTVALVSSGDPGIYAMATLVFELIDRDPRPDWQRVEVSVIPGISAFQAAAARVGAPAGHDTCLISLSDLLTPWPVIRRRVEAAAQADFVVCFYNPVSQRRRHQFAEAIDILRRHRGPGTPVVIGRSLGRPDERVAVRRLEDVTVDGIDMLSIVLVGSTETRRVDRPGWEHRAYTPRGYAAKAQSGPDQTRQAQSESRVAGGRGS